MKKEFEQKYHEVEKSHFWFKARREIILQYISSMPKNIKILDIGCSSGILLNDIQKLGHNPNNLYGIDISENAISNCKKNGLNNTHVMDAQNITLNEKFDLIIASDCLEHLELDQNALNNWYNKLNHNGMLCIFVPAFMLLWSEHDISNMHYRRYTKKELKHKLTESGFIISKDNYWNISLFIPMAIIRGLSKLLSIKNSPNQLNIPLFNKILYYLLSVENRLLKYIKFPFGISTYCIAFKK